MASLCSFTRSPDSTELAEALTIVTSAANPLGGMADLRWILMNSNEFRFLP